MRGLSTLFRVAAPSLGPIALAACCLLGETAAALTAPWIGGRFGQQLLEKADGDLYKRLLLIWLALLLAQYALRFASGYLMGSAGATATARLRTRIYDHLQALPLGYHDGLDRGETLTLLSRDAGIIGQFFTNTLPGLAPQLILLFGAWGMMVALDSLLGLLIGVAVVTVALAFQLLWRRIRPLASELAEAHAQHLGLAEENLRLLSIIKAFGREGLESERLAQRNRNILHLERRHVLLSSAVAPLVQGVGAVVLIVVLWLGAREVVSGNLSTGDAISLLLYGLLLFRPVAQLSTNAAGLYGAAGASERIIRALDSPTEPQDTGRQDLPSPPWDIRFEAIAFGYPSRPPLFNELDLRVRPAEVLAITGRNGAGKSTLIQLLMRFAEPQSGRILLGGVDIKELQLATLRRAIGLVPQQVALVNGSIRDNIAYGLPDADNERIRAAATQAQAMDFIARLPDGLDTIVGSNGVRLSGGQRQRVALARALLRDCPVLVLDEPTAMFDPESEAGFVTACRDSLAGRTVILITHRPASLALADRVLDLDRTADQQHPERHQGASH